MVFEDFDPWLLTQSINGNFFVIYSPYTCTLYVYMSPCDPCNLSMQGSGPQSLSSPVSKGLVLLRESPAKSLDTEAKVLAQTSIDC